nr:hypothetical protein [Tanacetum cinerariifolium]
ASVSVMPLSTYLNLGLGELAHTKLIVELVNRTVKYPKGIAENVLVVIMEYLVKISKKAHILELKRRHLKITVLTSNTPYASRKKRRICAGTSQKTTKETRLAFPLLAMKIPLLEYFSTVSAKWFPLVEARLVEFKEQETKFCERIRGVERDVEVRSNKIEYLTNELEEAKKEKESLDNKLTGFKNALKDLENLLGSQRTDKNKEGIGYSAVPPPAQAYSPPKNDLS